VRSKSSSARVSAGSKRSCLAASCARIARCTSLPRFALSGAIFDQERFFVRMKLTAGGHELAGDVDDGLDPVS
jgi:hypothetical protein